MAHGAAAGLPHGGYAVAALGIRAVAPGALRMDTQRLILLFIFAFPAHALGAWDKEHRPKPRPAVRTAPQSVPSPAKPVLHRKRRQLRQRPNGDRSAATGETVRVTTDLLVAEIDSWAAH